MSDLIEKYSGKTCYDTYLCRSEIESFKAFHGIFIGKHVNNDLVSWLSGTSKIFHSRHFYRDESGIVTGVKFCVYGTAGYFFVGDAEERSKLKQDGISKFKESDSFIFQKSKFENASHLQASKPALTDIATDALYGVMIIFLASFFGGIVLFGYFNG